MSAWHEPNGPSTYAQRIASYIRDPSTIRAYTLMEYGRAPSVQECARLRAKVQQKLDRQSEDEYRRVFPRVTPFYCGHTRDEENILWVGEHEKCAKCYVPPKPKEQKKKRPVKTDYRTIKTVPVVFPEGHLTPSVIVKYVAAMFGETPESICGFGRRFEQVYARAIIAKVLREDRGMALRWIGHFLGRDHKCPNNLIKQWPAYVKTRPVLAAQLELARAAARGEK